MTTLCALSLALAGPVLADATEIVAATARPGADGWQVSVTLRHPDSGWDHYADGWQIVTPEGQVAGLRPLEHPHETEQPFTRALSGIVIPEGLGHVFVQARGSVDGWTGPRFRLDLPR